MKYIIIVILVGCGFNSGSGSPDADPPIADTTIDAEPCNGITLYDGSCYFMESEFGYVWTHDQAAADCASKHAQLCDVTHVRWAFELYAAECAVAWTSTPCAGGYMAGYPYSPISTAGCTQGTNERCSPETYVYSANCCR